MMTKKKGVFSSYALNGFRAFASVLACSTSVVALSAGMSVIGGSVVHAGSCTETGAAGSYTCSDPADSDGNDNSHIFSFSGIPDDLTVTFERHPNKFNRSR